MSSARLTRPILHVLVAPTLIAALAACGGMQDVATSTGEGPPSDPPRVDVVPPSGPAAPTDAGAHDASPSVARLDTPAPPNGWVIPTCEPPSGPIHTYEDVDDFVTRLSHAWFLCEGVEPWFGRPEGAVGIEITPAKAYYLFEDNGVLVRKAGWDHDRTTEFLDTTGMNGPGHYQLNISNSFGTQIWITRTSEDGRFLEVAGAVAQNIRFVRATPAP